MHGIVKVEDGIINQSRRPPMPDELNLRVCPFCGKWIKERAHRCHHCKRWIHHHRTVNLNLDVVSIPGYFWDSSLICPKCQHPNTATAIKCQRCGRAFYSTPAVGPSGWDQAWENIRVFFNSSDRECPYCAEDIPQDAQVCPHCNIQFDG